MRLVVIDNQDSFTWNLVHLLGAHLGRLPRVIDHQASLSDLMQLSPEALVVSAGPGRPDRKEDFGLCATAIAELDLPILGVCLGHQGIGLAHGAKLIKAPEPMHGYRTRVFHDEDELMCGVAQGAYAVRYHSLCLGSLPPEITRMAWSEDDVVMGIRIPGRPKWGVQFHPESILTHLGAQLSRNFLRAAHDGNAIVWTRSGGLSSDNAIDEASTQVQRRVPAVYSRKLSICPDAASVFTKLFPSGDAFWFDGALDTRARYSYMGALGEASTLSELARALAPPSPLRQEGSGFSAPFSGGWVCALAYEALDPRHADDVSILRNVRRWIGWDHKGGHCALYALVFDDKGRASANGWFDDVERQLNDLPAQRPKPSQAKQSSQRRPVEVAFSCGDDAYRERVARAKAYLVDGESYELCVTDRALFEIEDDPLDYYLRLRAHNPAPYAAFIRSGKRAVASVSPELFLRVDEGGRCTTRPIKGTAPRSDQPEIDHAQAAELRMPRYVAENLMIVDLLRNDLGRVCELGSVQVPRLMEVETHPHVHQLVSTIEGRLRPGRTAWDAIAASFPGGSMTGAPKPRSMQILAQLEGMPRGLYAGALGYIGADGQAMLSIVIRTAVFEDRKASVGSGGAIVMASEPDAELREAKVKIRPLVACRVP